MRIGKLNSQKVTEEEALNPQTYNSYFHPPSTTLSLTTPTEAPYTFTRWLPLIARSQHIPSSLIPTTTLSRSQALTLLEASKVSLITRELSRTSREDLDEFVKPAFSTLDFLGESGGLFLRLDACSAKDGVQTGRGTALYSVDEIILRVTTSERAMSAVRKVVEGDDAEGVRLIFLPRNPRMESKREYRVFCPPPMGGIAAVSQYKWHQASMFKDLPDEELSEVLETVMRG
ncbi:hypothetical protein LSUE1_G010273, partial [Lachnellula suecica]